MGNLCSQFNGKETIFTAVRHGTWCSIWDCFVDSSISGFAIIETIPNRFVDFSAILREKFLLILHKSVPIDWMERYLPIKGS